MSEFCDFVFKQQEIVHQYFLVKVKQKLMELGKGPLWIWTDLYLMKIEDCI